MLVRSMVEKGLSERQALTVVRTSGLRYESRPNHNGELRELAHPHRRYGVGMIHLTPRQKGLFVNYKRVERLYQEAGLQLRRKRREEVPIGERQPPAAPVCCQSSVLDGFRVPPYRGRSDNQVPHHR